MRRWIASLPALASLAAAPAGAQLRPLDPIAWHRLEAGDAFHIGIGAAVFTDQEASLAGTRGTLYDLADVMVAWKTGRVLLEVSGPLVRRFDDREEIETPAAGVDPPRDELRRDAGDIRAETTVQLIGHASTALALRFGARLATTSVAPGLERDRTDFHAMLGGRYRAGRVSIAGEAGVGIFGTRGLASPQQSDVLTYAAGIEVAAGAVTPHAWVVGHDDLRGRRLRGNEDLAEVRIGVRAGRHVWLEASAVHGIADYSPGPGLLLMVGLRL